MSDLRMYLLGTPRIEFRGSPVKIERRKALALAAYLALTQQRQSRDAVAALLWPDLDDEHARSALRTTVRALTTPIPLEWIQADRTTLALNQNMVWVDVSAFIELLSRSNSHGHSLDAVCDECVNLHKQALELYQSDFLAGFHLPDNQDYDDWKMLQNQWLRRELIGILRRVAHYEAEAEHYEQAISYAQRWLSLDMLNEAAHRLLMQFLAASGQRSEALRQYQQCVDILNRELATPPEEETTRLHEHIQSNSLAKEQSSEATTGLATSVLPPLPSLIVGRGDELISIKQRLGIGTGEMRPATVIQGWPGVGKSTIVALLAHDVEIAHQFPDGILWTSLGENPDLAGEVVAWGGALRLAESGRTRRIDEISAQITAILRDRRVLLIVDDVWQADHATPFRVGGQSCALVMTTRLNDVASALAPTADDIYRLPVLSEAAGLELLGKLTPETVMQYPDETQKLVHDLEGLPLAIHVAGRLLHTEARLGWGVGELLVELREGANLLSEKPPSEMIGVGHDTPLTVAALLKRSTDALDSEMRNRFAFLGLFVPKPATFDLAAMAALWGESDPKTIARHLVARGLLEPISGGRFQMHALLVLHARSLLESDLENLP